jgi:nitrogen fixation-related uncharacterized protein
MKPRDQLEISWLVRAHGIVVSLMERSVLLGLLFSPSQGQYDDDDEDEDIVLVDVIVRLALGNDNSLTFVCYAFSFVMFNVKNAFRLLFSLAFCLPTKRQTSLRKEGEKNSMTMMINCVCSGIVRADEVSA